MITIIGAGGLLFLIIAIGLVLKVTVADPPDLSPGHAEREAEAERNRSSTPAQRAAAQQLINAFGYDCGDVDVMVPFLVSEGWTVWCNQMRYQFEIANHGGKWSVSAK